MGFLENIPCPKCREQGRDRKGDNLGVYTDGGWYCWSCGFHKRGVAYRPQEPLEQPLEAFSRWSKVLPPQETENLLKRGFKASELQDFMYDYTWRRRIYPVYRGQELVFYEARSSDGSAPKSIQKGEKPIHILGSGKYLVMVEDLLSAIKVSRFEQSMPLWGSSIIRDWIPYIIGRKQPVIVWLDEDKYRTALGIANTYSLVGLETRVIRTEKDPKDLNDEEIKEALYAAEKSDRQEATELQQS